MGWIHGCIVFLTVVPTTLSLNQNRYPYQPQYQGQYKYRPQYQPNSRLCSQMSGARCITIGSNCPQGTQMDLSFLNYNDCNPRFSKCCIGQQQNKCNTMMGGECVHQRVQCPAGTSMKAMASNYLFCGNVNAKCCTGRGQFKVTNPPITQRPIVRNPYGDSCGVGTLKPNPRILNGFDTGPCDWPFIVSLRSTSPEKSNRLDYQSTYHACAGVLIDRQWVLTSAFCVLSGADNASNARNRLIVVAGDYNISKVDTFPNDGLPQEQIFFVQRAIIHPSYKYTDSSQVDFNDPISIKSNNLALIKLHKPIAPARCAGISCLPLFEEINNDRLHYDECVILGWGLVKGGENKKDTDLLKMSYVQMSSPKACDVLTRRLKFEKDRARGTICQAPTEGLTDGCLGDEGGPVLCYTGRNWVVRGILPFNMCFSSSYNLYVTEVVQYLRWIKDTMARFRF